jgi:hypothetical protein
VADSSLDEYNSLDHNQETQLLTIGCGATGADHYPDKHIVEYVKCLVIEIQMAGKLVIEIQMAGKGSILKIEA